MEQKTDLPRPFKVSDEFKAWLVEHVLGRGRAEKQRVQVPIGRQLDSRGAIRELWDEIEHK